MAQLKFYYGTMGSGKTTELLKTADIYDRKGVEVAIIKPIIDDRNGKQEGWGTIESRLVNNLSKKAYYFKNIVNEVTNKIPFEMLFVDEAQFLSSNDIKELATYVDVYNIDVYCYGLKNDVSGRMFSGSRELMTIADECIEMKNLCQYDRCRNNANFHLRYIDGVVDTSNIPIMIEKGNVTYKSLCRKHYMKEMNINSRD
jgi:thymidine kinase